MLEFNNEINRGCWESGFSLLEWEVLDKQGEKAKMILMLMEFKWR